MCNGGRLRRSVLHVSVLLCGAWCGWLWGRWCESIALWVRGLEGAGREARRGEARQGKGREGCLASILRSRGRGLVRKWEATFRCALKSRSAGRKKNGWKGKVSRAASSLFVNPSTTLVARLFNEIVGDFHIGPGAGLDFVRHLQTSHCPRSAHVKCSSPSYFYRQIIGKKLFYIHSNSIYHRNIYINCIK